MIKCSAEYSKYIPPSEFEVKMEGGLTTLEGILSKNSEVQSQTTIINMASKNDQQLDMVMSGLIYGCLTSKNLEQFTKFSKLLQQTASLNPTITLTPINYMIIEKFWTTSDVIQQNMIQLLAEMTKWRITKIEIALGNAMRQFMDFGSMASRYQLLLGYLRILKNNSEFLFKSNESGLLIASTITACVHYLSEIKQCPSFFVNDSKRILIQVTEMIMTIYFDQFQAVFGRNVILVITSLSRFPEIAAIWKKFVLSPTNMGVLDLIRRPPEQWLESNVLPITTTRKLEFLHQNSSESTQPHFLEFLKNMIGNDGSMKALCLRAFLNPCHATDFQTMDVRAMNIANLLSTCNSQNESYNFVEFQTCKMAFFFDWLGYDTLPLNSNLPLPIVTSWKALYQICTTNGPLLCSLYEFLILLVQTLYPPLAPIFVKSVTRIFQCLSINFPVASLLDSTKLEKPLRELFKETFPELIVFFRKPNIPEFIPVIVPSLIEKAARNISVMSIVDPTEAAETTTQEQIPEQLKPNKQIEAPVVTSNYDNDEDSEKILFKNRCKLYILNSDTKETEERGVGDIKVLFNPENKSYRAVMRREQVHTICANFHITKGMNIADKTGTKGSFSCTDFSENSQEGTPTVFFIRFLNEKVYEEFKKLFNDIAKGNREYSTTAEPFYHISVKKEKTTEESENPKVHPNLSANSEDDSVEILDEIKNPVKPKINVVQRTGQIHQMQIEGLNGTTFKAKIYDYIMPTSTQTTQCNIFIPPNLDQLQQILIKFDLNPEFAFDSPLISSVPVDPQGKSMVTMNTVGDGNCAFRALSRLFTGVERFHWQIRLKIYEYISQHGHLIYGIRSANIAYENNLKFQRLSKMKPRPVNQDLYAGNDDFFALADMLDANVYTYTPTPQRSFPNISPHFKNNAKIKGAPTLFLIIHQNYYPNMPIYQIPMLQQQYFPGHQQLHQQPPPQQMQQQFNQSFPIFQNPNQRFNYPF
uniref:OTU domain-containing protein n=1 Tax=Panagrolaimus davidi TaxID=227884 RepID=A0A914QLL4_9BILA